MSSAIAPTTEDSAQDAQLVDGGFLAERLATDVPVFRVSHPARDAELLCALRGPRPEVDALDLAADLTGDVSATGRWRRVVVGRQNFESRGDDS